MSPIMDLTGHRFGALTVLEKGPRTSSGKIQWLCKCDCGNMVLRRTDNLGKKTCSCGCLTNVKNIALGTRFGKLTVISSLGKGWFLCKCDCGGEKITLGRRLRRGDVESCGCLLHEKCFKHGEKDSRLYFSWKNMKNRCTNKNAHSYRNYGGRGISVCEEWRQSYTAFRDWAIASGYRDNLTIDRIDVNGNYCPENCRWVLPSDQALNKTSNRQIEWRGKTQPLCVWSKELGINYGTLKGRLNRGWDVESAMTTPAKNAESKEKCNDLF